MHGASDCIRCGDKCVHKVVAFLAVRSSQFQDRCYEAEINLMMLIARCNGCCKASRKPLTHFLKVTTAAGADGAILAGVCVSPAASVLPLRSSP
jgi:hypothetical protein